MTRTPAFGLRCLLSDSSPKVSIDRDGTASYTYDALNQRDKMVTSAGTDRIGFDILGRWSTTWQDGNAYVKLHQYYSDQGPVAVFSNAAGVLSFEHQDWLGTERLRTDNNGSSNVSTFSSLPFGEPNLTSGNDLYGAHFTGMDEDGAFSASSLGLHHATFREYNSTLGRWMSPDPYSGSYDLAKPQSLNRYSYVMNNPLARTDLSGLDGNDCGDDYGDDGSGGGGDGGGYSGGGYAGGGFSSQPAPNPNGDGSFVFTVTVTGTGDPDPGPSFFDIWQASTFAFFGPLSGGGSAGSSSSSTSKMQKTSLPLPTNAMLCTTSTGVNFMAPPGFSVNNIAANGTANGLVGAPGAVAQFGYYDFQRYVTGSTTFDFYGGYTPVANIAVGAYLAGIPGMTQLEGGTISNYYAKRHSANGATSQQAQFRNLGFALASGKATYTCQSHP